IMAIVLVLAAVPFGAAAAEKKPLFTINDFSSRQGEEVALTIKFNQGVTKSANQINALDVALKYDKDVFEVLSLSKGSGLVAALNALKEGNLGVDTGGYIYSESANTPGEVIWSLSSIEGFTFTNGSAFAIVRVKIKNASNLENSPAFTVEVTSAAKLSSDKKTIIDRTNDFVPYTNKATIAINLATLCDWEFNSETQTYTLVRFKDTKATKFIVPDTFDDGVNGEHPVANIKTSAFRYNAKLEEISLGANITNVSSAAFTGCSRLKLALIYSENAAINANAFYGAANDLVIRCVKGSPADEYAQLNGITVEYFGDINKCTVEGVETQKNYNGSPLTMDSIVITDSEGTVLTEGVDYIIEYKNNIEIGQGTATIKGKGAFFGSIEYKFDILCPYHVDDGNEYFTRTAPTYEDCTLGGEYVEHCSKCGYTAEFPLPAKEHAKGEWKVLSDATCTQEGLKAFICPDCGKHLQEEVIEKLPHKYEWITEKDPTCKETGVKKYVCSDCGDVKETQEIPVVDHNKEWVVTKEAKCKEDGEKILRCTYCGEVYQTEVIPQYGEHQPAAEWTVVEATCTEPGEKYVVCVKCGEKLSSEVIEPKGHTESDLVTKEATCLEDGYKTVYCTTCEKVLRSEVLPKKAHTPAKEWSTISTPTCTTKGVEVLLCTECSTKLDTRETNPLGHDVGANEWTVIVPATCTENGLQARICKRENCGARVQEKDIKATGHTSTGVKTITEATCTHAGKKADKCSVCGEYFNEKTIAQKEHTYGAWETIVEPTCTEKGLKQSVCTSCKVASKTEEIPLKAHVSKEEYVVAPTYKYTGSARVVCANCGKVIKNTYTVARVNPDLDGDKRFSAADALLILQHSVEIKLLNATQQKNADCNGDRRINSADALIVLQLSTGELTY
ncbi:MAG: leucine-rich repeat protein, partial [Clostridia bacterium]|nr:leucine-rich repeat protein [Clostridia bacterium]